MQRRACTSACPTAPLSLAINLNVLRSPTPLCCDRPLATCNCNHSMSRKPLLTQKPKPHATHVPSSGTAPARLGEANGHLPRIEGQRAVAESAPIIIRTFRRTCASYLTLYSFSVRTGTDQSDEVDAAEDNLIQLPSKKPKPPN